MQNEYFDWFWPRWVISHGLITQSHASRILGVTSTRVCQMIKEGKLSKKLYVFGDDPSLVSMTEVLEIMANRKK